jgi:hypothetical protein
MQEMRVTSGSAHQSRRWRDKHLSNFMSLLL